jgi:hypothetical protein
MNVEQLHLVLQQSFSADAAVRHPAEETIRNLKHLPGAVQLLLQVAAEKQVRNERTNGRNERASNDDSKNSSSIIVYALCIFFFFLRVDIPATLFLTINCFFPMILL